MLWLPVIPLRESLSSTSTKPIEHASSPPHRCGSGSGCSRPWARSACGSKSRSQPSTRTTPRPHFTSLPTPRHGYVPLIDFALILATTRCSVFKPPRPGPKASPPPKTRLRNPWCRLVVSSLLVWKPPKLNHSPLAVVTSAVSPQQSKFERPLLFAVIMPDSHHQVDLSALQNKLKGGLSDEAEAHVNVNRPCLKPCIELLMKVSSSSSSSSPPPRPPARPPALPYPGPSVRRSDTLTDESPGRV